MTKDNCNYLVFLVLFTGTVILFTCGIHSLFEPPILDNVLSKISDMDSPGFYLGFVYSSSYVFLLSKLENYYLDKREKDFDKELLKRENKIKNANILERQKIVALEEADFEYYNKIFQIEQPLYRAKWGRFMSYDNYLNYSIIYNLRVNSTIYKEELEKIISTKLNHNLSNELQQSEK